MIRRTVALTGIPGVGKSTLLTTLSTRLEFASLQASALIWKGREQALGETTMQDRLRYADLGESQQLLIRGFDASATEAMPLVLLDSHSVIERDDDHVPIDAAVFGALGIRAMIFLHDDPAAICARRVQDARRQRPKKDAAALEQLQKAAYAHAGDICRALRIQLYIATPRDVDELSKILRCERDGQPD